MINVLLTVISVFTTALKRLKANFAHYLVYPERSVAHPGCRKMRQWLLDQAAVQP